MSSSTLGTNFPSTHSPLQHFFNQEQTPHERKTSSSFSAALWSTPPNSPPRLAMRIVPPQSPALKFELTNSDSDRRLPYYTNLKTHQSQWTPPTSPATSRPPTPEPYQQQNPDGRQVTIEHKPTTAGKINNAIVGLEQGFKSGLKGGRYGGQQQSRDPYYDDGYGGGGGGGGYYGRRRRHRGGGIIH